MKLQDRLNEPLAGRYRVGRELGSGGMSVVFLAEDIKHGRDVALKVLRPEVGHDLGSDRFLREIRIAATLSHPNILPLFDSGEADGLLYYVMPYVPGETLARRIARDGPLPIGEAIQIVVDVARALEKAHEAGVIHRDIKPSNILMESGQARVADFGVARAIDAAGDRVTRSGVAVGSPTYMSPEQASGEHALDARSDIYSLGCVAYELITGRPPFQGSTAQAVVAGHLSRPPPPISDSRRGVPVPVEEAIRRALAKDRGDRFGTATDFAHALVRANTEAARVAHRRRRWYKRLAAMAAVVVVALVGLRLVERASGPAVERLAVLPAANLTGDSTQNYFVSGVHQALVAELQRAGVATMARQSVLKYRDTDKTVREIARELGVDALIEPAVGVEGDSVTVEVSLVDGRTQLPIWSGRFDRPMSGVLGLYRQLSAAIAAEVGTALTGEEVERLAARPLIDPRAYQEYLLGQYHLGLFTPNDFERAKAYFESAIARDSTYAEAYMGLRAVWGYQAQAGLIAPAEAKARQGELLDRALALDPDLPEAHRIEANRRAWQERDPEGAEPLFRRAIELDPGHARVRAFHGHVLTILGRWDEAEQEMRAAIDLDPLDPFVKGLYGGQLTMVGRFDEALAVLEELYETTPAAGFGDVFYALTLHEAGRHDEEFAMRLQNYASRGETRIAEAFQEGWQAGGHEGAAQRLIDIQISERERRFVPAFGIATELIELGAFDEAVDWLETDVEEGGSNIPYYGVLPPLWPLHDHLRFRALLDELGITPNKPPGR